MEHYRKVKVVGFYFPLNMLVYVYLSGQGSFGKAILVENTVNHRQYLLKEINISKLSTKDKDDTVNEIRILSKLRFTSYYIS